jgi:L-2-hydroxycarboxylate dehydrogenase (NAD+)
MTDEDASLCADAMLWSDLRGAPTHGMTGRLPQTVDRIRGGAVNPTPRWPVVLADSPSSIALDADGGWGQVAGTKAMRLAVDRARDSGVGLATLRYSDVTGAMGWYANVAVEAGMIGYAVNNTVPLMAAWGGIDKVIGNQAFAIGCPAGRHPPILFDSVLTRMSNGAIRDALERAEQLPSGVAMDTDGEPTTDPAEALTGIMVPAGGHRGSGLAIMWEVLTGVLAGGHMTPDVRGPHDPEEPMGLSMLLLAIDPSSSMSRDTFTERVDRLVDLVHGSRPAPGFDRVRMPGERGHEIADRNRRLGIPVPPERAARLRSLGQDLGVPWDWTLPPHA